MSKQTHGDTQCYKPALPENRSVYIPVIKRVPFRRLKKDEFYRLLTHTQAHYGKMMKMYLITPFRKL